MSLACRKSTRFGVMVLVVALIAMFVPRVLAQTTRPTEYRTVKVTGGEVRGVIKDGVAAFKGIPFAAPPVGDLRWQAPQPVKTWDGVRDADKFGPAPMQPALAAALLGGGARISEDCLYLNVWTATKDASDRRPVMVWIYGGAYIMGATSSPLYDGTAFAKKGVVLVSVAYRVGPFGFLAHPELRAENGEKGSGNYGIQDQIAGLRWVQDNIARFGGDSSRVTIFGESAGGTSVSILAASPAAKGLFHRVISESGVPMLPATTIEKGEEQGKKFVADLGVKDIRAARALGADDVQQARFEASAVADQENVVGDPYERYLSGQFNDTPLLLGSNSDDGGMFTPSVGSPAEFEKRARAVLDPEGADGILAVYPHSTKAEAARSARDAVRDMVFGWPAWTWARMQTKKGKSKAYLYYFDYGSKPGGAGHASELPYVFGNLGGLLGPKTSTSNVTMSNTIMSYWVNFATTGDPNGPDLPQWPAFDEKPMSTMIFGQAARVDRTPNLEKLEACDAYHAQTRKQQRK